MPTGGDADPDRVRRFEQEAHAQLANLHGLLCGYGVISPGEALPRMRDEARKALAIDPHLPEGHAMLGTAAAWFDFDWPEAERHFRFAMAQGTVSPLVRLNYAMYCLLPTWPSGVLPSPRGSNPWPALRSHGQLLRASARWPALARMLKLPE